MIVCDIISSNSGLPNLREKRTTELVRKTHICTKLSSHRKTSQNVLQWPTRKTFALRPDSWDDDNYRTTQSRKLISLQAAHLTQLEESTLTFGDNNGIGVPLMRIKEKEISPGAGGKCKDVKNARSRKLSASFKNSSSEIHRSRPSSMNNVINKHRLFKEEALQNAIRLLDKTGRLEMRENTLNINPRSIPTKEEIISELNSNKDQTTTKLQVAHSKKQYPHNIVKIYDKEKKRTQSCRMNSREGTPHVKPMERTEFDKKLQLLTNGKLSLPLSILQHFPRPTCSVDAVQIKNFPMHQMQPTSHDRKVIPPLTQIDMTNETQIMSCLVSTPILKMHTGKRIKLRPPLNNSTLPSNNNDRRPMKEEHDVTSDEKELIKSTSDSDGTRSENRNDDIKSNETFLNLAIQNDVKGNGDLRKYAKDKVNRESNGNRQWKAKVNNGEQISRRGTRIGDTNKTKEIQISNNITAKAMNINTQQKKDVNNPKSINNASKTKIPLTKNETEAKKHIDKVTAKIVINNESKNNLNQNIGRKEMKKVNSHQIIENVKETCTKGTHQQQKTKQSEQRGENEGTRGTNKQIECNSVMSIASTITTLPDEETYL